MALVGRFRFGFSAEGLAGEAFGAAEMEVEATGAGVFEVDAASEPLMVD